MRLIAINLCTAPFMIHYSYIKEIGVLTGWIFPHFSNYDIKIFNLISKL